jgi:pimeloyl-ACP methyl ester carboxylesterase
MPGTERLVEFCTALRQIGFVTVQFHYSGSWGSDGDFSLDHCYEDANTLLDHLLADETGMIDKNSLFAVGHSMGGLIAAKLIAGRPEIGGGALIVPASYGYKYRRAMESKEAEAGFRKNYDNYGKWLTGFGWESVKSEVSKDPDSYDLEYYRKELAGKPLLAVSATMDTDVPREWNIDRMTAAIRETGSDRLSELTLKTDHSLSDQRRRLKMELAKFFAALV